MKTSRSQYDLLLTYMEHHGDLSKPQKTSGGRAINLQRWCELVDLLNNDSTGDKKSDVKWKKVWSDFKNNTKRKAARLHHAAISPDGGPVSNTKLSDLEQRVLGIISTQAATCLSDVMEAGFAEPNTPSEQESQHSAFASVEIRNEGMWGRPGSSSCSHTFPTPLIQPTEVVEVAIRPESPSPWTAQDDALAPSPSGETPCRRVRGSSVRRSRKLGRTDPYFLCEEWRTFKTEQHRDWIEMKREQNRMRELELENHRQWQNLCREALGLFRDFLNKK